MDAIFPPLLARLPASRCAVALFAVSFACNGGGAQRTSVSAGTTTATSSAATAATAGTTAAGSTATAASAGGSTGDTGTDTAPATAGSGTAATTGGPGCAFCDAPNEKCIDDTCVTTCQGAEPDPCGPAQVCDVLSGECVDPGAACSLSGGYVDCGAGKCGPGTVCDGQGTCIPVAPCAEAVCLDDGHCWGAACTCERQHDCIQVPDEQALNGPFSDDIFDMEFAYDCTAWMVTLRGGTDYVRRLTPDGTLTEWAGVANLNMGEVAVLKPLTPVPQVTKGLETLAGRPVPPAPSDHWGEVAITYTCCATCGCFVDPPQGVARLDEADMAEPLPLVIPATVTQGSGPFGNTPADAGPMGLTWGQDRVLYVGNSTADGNLDTADLDAMTQSQLATLPARVTAGAPISGAHLLFALEGGALYRYNVLTDSADFLLDLGEDVTALSLDSFSGHVYASLRNLDVVRVDPWTLEVTPFAVMPAIGRVTVSPEGRLYYVPAKYVLPNPPPISSWDLPDNF